MTAITMQRQFYLKSTAARRSGWRINTAASLIWSSKTKNRARRWKCIHWASETNEQKFGLGVEKKEESEVDSLLEAPQIFADKESLPSMKAELIASWLSLYCYMNTVLKEERKLAALKEPLNDTWQALGSCGRPQMKTCDPILPWETSMTWYTAKDVFGMSMWQE